MGPCPGTGPTTSTQAWPTQASQLSRARNPANCVTRDIYSEVFDTETATAIGRINDALNGRADPASTEGLLIAVARTYVTEARQPTKADARHRAPALLSNSASNGLS